MVERIRNEPVLAITVVGASITLLTQFGIPLTDGQSDAITGLAWALLALVARRGVTPVRRTQSTQPA